MGLSLSIRFSTGSGARARGFVGFLLRGLLYGLLNSVDSEVAKSVHGGKRLSPFSVGPVVLEGPRRGVVFRNIPSGSVGWFRFSALSAREGRLLRDALISCEVVRMGEVDAHVLEVGVSEIDYRRIWAESKPIKSFSVRFLTPTYFRRSLVAACCPSCPVDRRVCERLVEKRRRRLYRFVPYPDPYLFLRSLARLWRSFSPVSLGYRRYVEWLVDGGVAVAGFKNLRTHRVEMDGGRWSVGFTGLVRFNLPDDTFDKKMAKITDALLRFGRYSNVGGNRTAGFGAIDYVPKEYL